MDENVDLTAIRSQPLGAPAAPVYPAPDQPPPRKRRMSTGLLVALFAAAVILAGGGTAVIVLALTGHSPVPGAPATFTSHGTLQISGGCSGIGYDDIHDGTQVVLTDEGQKVIAVGELRTYDTCSWDFTLAGVPAGKKFYGVTISHRGTLQYTEQQLRDGPHLSLGG